MKTASEFSFSLHVMSDDGSDIRQVTFNQSHDLDPLVLGDGRVAFTRWDNMGGRNAFNIYSMNPDGTDQQLLYGANSHATGTGGATIQFSQPRETLDGQIMALIRPFHYHQPWRRRSLQSMLRTISRIHSHLRRTVEFYSDRRRLPRRSMTFARTVRLPRVGHSARHSRSGTVRTGSL